MKRQAGFTLIELIMVIVVLGILAATAAPKFANMQSVARIAALNGVMSAMNTAGKIAHSVQQMTGVASNVAVTIDGQSINMVNGYPASAAPGIYETLDIDKTTYVWSTASGVYISGTIACYVGWTEATGGATATAASATGLTTTDC